MLNSAAAISGADGIICFGGVDWWYHNRGHYDLQMMRELSRHLPVLYVNSLGMRLPRASEGAIFMHRVRRKLASLSRGLVQVSAGFSVYTPLAWPAGAAGLVKPAARRLLAWQVRAAATRCGIHRPVLWVACPTAATILDLLPRTALVYQRTDRFEDFGGVDPVAVGALDRTLKREADLVLFCSRHLFLAEGAACARATFVDHGVDYDRFAAAGAGGGPAPPDMADLARPRIGFVGSIDAHSFDPTLLLTVAASLPQCRFVLVGGCSLPDGWCALPNVHLLGQRPYQQVADYMAACDVLIMPWNNSQWIQACNPVKLKEYLAVGRPVVSTPFPELAYYREHVAVAADAPAFAAAIRQSLAQPGEATARRARVRAHTWVNKALLAWQELAAAVRDVPTLAT